MKTIKGRVPGTDYLKKDILYIQAVSEDFGKWTINFRATYNGNNSGHINARLSGYGKDQLLEHVPAGTKVIITGKINIAFLLKNTNVDHSGPSYFDNNLTNEQYIAGMLENGCTEIQL